jgi:DNA invertase Pin-like site-specific DNA recombinase
LDGRELLMESATDKFLMARWTFAADLEREKAKQRTSMPCSGRHGRPRHRAAIRLRTMWTWWMPPGKRSHVEYRINPTEAGVVRRIFQLRAEGVGQSTIAKQLNAERAVTPRIATGPPRRGPHRPA